jgi:hypothetical protein
MQTIYKFKTIETFLPKSSNQAYYSLHTETINAATPSVAHFLYQGLQSHKSLFPRSRFMEQALPAGLVHLPPIDLCRVRTAHQQAAIKR